MKFNRYIVFWETSNGSMTSIIAKKRKSARKFKKMILKRDRIAYIYDAFLEQRIS